MISGIRWVSELIEAAGGIDVFPALSLRKNAKDRIVPARDVIAAAPDIIVGSWCGKKFVPAKVAARPGFDAVPAVRDGWLREIKSTLILQPGPAALTDGLDALGAHRRGMGGAARPDSYCCAASRVSTLGQIVERRDQARPAAQRVAARQHDPPLRRIERPQRRMREIERALPVRRLERCSSSPGHPGAASISFSSGTIAAIARRRARRRRQARPRSSARRRGSAGPTV